MNILILNYEYPPLGGGAGVCSQYHAKGLAQCGYRVTVLTAWFKGYSEIEYFDNLTIVRLKSQRKFLYKSNPVEMLMWVKQAILYFASNQDLSFSICLANFIIPGGIVAKYLKRKFGIPYFILSHGQDIPFFFPKQMLKYHLITYFWLRSIVSGADKLLLLTQMIKKNADSYLGKNNRHKNMVIANGCDTETFYPDYTNATKEFTILFVGRLVEQKDPFTFLKAVKLLAELNVQFKVIILGDGPLRKKMLQFCNKYNLTQRVDFKGWVSKPEMVKHYQQASLQVMSSRDEAMSIAALESLSCGTYMLSTPVSGNTDLIENEINGEFFDFSDSKGLASKIEKFYFNRFLTGYQVPEIFLKRFRNTYNWDTIVKEYDKLIKFYI